MTCFLATYKIPILTDLTRKFYKHKMQNQFDSSIYEKILPLKTMTSFLISHHCFELYFLNYQNVRLIVYNADRIGSTKQIKSS